MWMHLVGKQLYMHPTFNYVKWLKIHVGWDASFPCITTLHRTNGLNNCISELANPSKIALCESVAVMLLKNFVVESNLMNGAVSVVRKMVYKKIIEPRGENKAHVAYVIVQQKCSNSWREKVFPNLPSNCVPIPVVTETCVKQML